MPQVSPQLMGNFFRGLIFYNFPKTEPALLQGIYIASYYFCCYTMTSVGYGDFTPRNVLERMVCTWIVLTSGLSWAYILGEVCAIVSEMTVESQRFRKKMHHLNSLMEEQGGAPNSNRGCAKTGNGCGVLKYFRAPFEQHD